MKNVWRADAEGQLIFILQNEDNARAELIRAIELYPHDLDWLELLFQVVTHLSSPSANPLTTQWPENPPIIFGNVSCSECTPREPGQPQ